MVAMSTVAGGYYFVASDGDVFAYRVAPFLGSMGGKPLNAHRRHGHLAPASSTFAASALPPDTIGG